MILEVVLWTPHVHVHTYTHVLTQVLKSAKLSIGVCAEGHELSVRLRPYINQCSEDLQPFEVLATHRCLAQVSCYVPSSGVPRHRRKSVIQ